MRRPAWYRNSALIRRFNPTESGDRGILVVTAIAALAGLISAVMQGLEISAIFMTGLVFGLAVFGSWALGRELLPDDPWAAYISLILAFLACLAFDSPGILALFTTLALVRMVNRSEGRAALKSDSVLVTLLVILTVYVCESPWFAAVAALAFLLDASLKTPSRGQLLFAALCLGTMVEFVVDYDVPWLDIHAPHTLLQWLAVSAILLFGLHLTLINKVNALTGVDGQRLSPDRVKAGIVIALLACLQGLDPMSEFVLLLATIGGLCLGIAFRRSFRASNQGLRS